MEPTLKIGDYVWTRKPRKDSVERSGIYVFTSDGTIGSRYLIKRCIGLPGDTVQIINNRVFVNSEFIDLDNIANMRYRITPYARDYRDSIYNRLNSLQVGYISYYSGQYFIVEMKPNKITDVESALREYATIKTEFEDENSFMLYPNDSTINSTLENFGPVIIPKHGMIIHDTDSSFVWYKPIVVQGETISISKKSIVNSTTSSHRSFKIEDDYLFMLGDNWYESYDSRYFGFVSISRIKAQATRVLFSKPK
jgi:signal peptidase I